MGLNYTSLHRLVPGNAVVFTDRLFRPTICRRKEDADGTALES
jgi:hypothetical protein